MPKKGRKEQNIQLQINKDLTESYEELSCGYIKQMTSDKYPDLTFFSNGIVSYKKGAKVFHPQYTNEFILGPHNGKGKNININEITAELFQKEPSRIYYPGMYATYEQSLEELDHEYLYLNDYNNIVGYFDIERAEKEKQYKLLAVKAEGTKISFRYYDLVSQVAKEFGVIDSYIRKCIKSTEEYIEGKQPRIRRKAKGYFIMWISRKDYWDLHYNIEDVKWDIANKLSKRKLIRQNSLMNQVTEETVPDELQELKQKLLNTKVSNIKINKAF